MKTKKLQKYLHKMSELFYLEKDKKMKICNEEHEEVCYEAKNCPCCELFEEIADLKEENEILHEKLDEATKPEEN